VIGLLVAAATLAFAATSFADVTPETVAPAPPEAEAPPVTAPTVTEDPPAADVPPPVIAEAAPTPAPAEAAPAEAPPAAPPPALAAAAPKSAQVSPPAASQVTGDTEPQCVVTAPDGSCALQSTDCDILGDDGDNELFGTPNGDIICGLGGNDMLEGGDGDDTLVGGPGADRYSGDEGRDCFLTDDDDEPPAVVPGPDSDGVRLPGSDEPYPGRCDSRHPLKPPATDTGPDPPPGAGDVATVGALYVALTRYAGAEQEPQAVAAIAVIATRAVAYGDGEIKFLVRCTRAGSVRVTLAALRGQGRRVKLGATTFECQGEGDDPLVRVELPGRARRLVESSAEVRVRAELAEAGAANASRQTFVLTP
jgi:RTX calcium-binding nonapeptide repeat (4 copies)